MTATTKKCVHRYLIIDAADKDEMNEILKTSLDQDVDVIGPMHGGKLEDSGNGGTIVGYEVHVPFLPGQARVFDTLLEQSGIVPLSTETVGVQQLKNLDKAKERRRTGKELIR